MRTYKYVGDIAHYIRSGDVNFNTELYNYENRNIPPVRVSASEEMFKYIDDLCGHDDEEKYLEKEFYYDMFFNLLAVAIPGDDDRPAKVVISSQVNGMEEIIRPGKVRFYGTDKRIDSRKPDSMSNEEYDRLYNDMHKAGAFKKYEYPIDYWATVRHLQKDLERKAKRIVELEDKLSEIAGIARNAE